MRPKEYIGITGFMSRQDIDDVLAVLPAESDTIVMIGVLASGKTIHGLPNKWPKRYPPSNELGTLFEERKNTLNLIHFNTKNLDLLLLDIRRAYALAGPHCHGFQLNMAWPDKDILAAFRTSAPPTRRTIVLQCGGHALNLLDHDPIRIADRVAEYEGLIDYVLIDPSGGLGQEFDVDFAQECFRALTDRTPESIGLGSAGGLHAGNLDRLEPLLGDFRFSIDAEGQLRDNNDDLDVSETREYLATADKLFQDYRVSV